MKSTEKYFRAKQSNQNIQIPYYYQDSAYYRNQTKIIEFHRPLEL